jgi:NCAIR mutase (PurE)-related protein
LSKKFQRREKSLAPPLSSGCLLTRPTGTLKCMDPLEAISRADNSRPATATLPTASVDLDRHRRCGFPEVVFGQGKTIEQIRGILAALVAG